MLLIIRQHQIHHPAIASDAVLLTVRFKIPVIHLGGGICHRSIKTLPELVVPVQVPGCLRGQLCIEVIIAFRVRLGQGIACIDPAGQVAAVAKVRGVRADTCQISDEVGLIFPRKALQMGQFVA